MSDQPAEQIDPISIAERLEEIARELRAKALMHEHVPDHDGTTLAQRLKKERSRLRLTQEELAEKAEVSPNTIINIEGGKSSPRPQTIYALADAMGISPLRLDDV